jgi:hypothetical protein
MWGRHEVANVPRTLHGFRDGYTVAEPQQCHGEQALAKVQGQPRVQQSTAGRGGRYGAQQGTNLRTGGHGARQSVQQPTSMPSGPGLMARPGEELSPSHAPPPTPRHPPERPRNVRLRD